MRLKMRHEYGIIVIFVITVLAECSEFASCDLEISQQELVLAVNDCSNVSLKLTEPISENGTINIQSLHQEIAITNLKQISVPAKVKYLQWDVEICAHQRGRTLITAELIPHPQNGTWETFIQVTVGYSGVLQIISDLIGWIYFVAWTISFYGQIITNFKRKSVVGLNFDFVALNIVGFILYSMFNCGLFWLHPIQKEYQIRNPRGLNPVLLNDVLFSLHAAAASITVLIQCLIYERGSQKVSYTATGLLGIYFAIMIVSAVLSFMDKLKWLDFLYICSYIKLSITLFKYIPQAIMNYRRKSTVGWSIFNVICDFTGGTFSVLQMIINAYNYDDWASIFGDPTKFGLGIFSIFFDVIFLVQHYILYRNREQYLEIEEEGDEEQVTTPGPLHQSQSQPITIN